MEDAPGPIVLTYAGSTAELMLNRPAKRNALNAAMWQALPDVVGEAVGRRETRVLVIRGAAGHFAAGADIAEFDEVFATPATTRAYADAMAAATLAIESAPVPVLAQLEGLCIGAGVAVAMACDLRFAAHDAEFAVTPAKLGLVFPLSDTRRLSDAIGPSATKRLLFTGRRIDAAEAHRIGLVDEVVPHDDLAGAVAQAAAAMADVSAWSISKAKLTMRRIAEGAVDDTEETRALFDHAPQGADYREGVAAFRARRPPVFPKR